MPAKVEPLTAWAKRGDHGDVALLQLEAPVTIEPVRLAPLNVELLKREVRVYGFRKGMESQGRT